MPYIVEFVGVPGSGKTFSSLRLESKLRSEGLRFVSYSAIISNRARVIRMTNKLFSTIGFMIKFPSIFFHFSDLMMSNKYINRLAPCSILINYFHLLSFLFRFRSSSSPVVFEQGIFQIGWAMIYYSKNREESLRIFEIMIKYALDHIDCSRYVLVYVLPANDVLVDRMRTRNFTLSNIKERLDSLNMLRSAIDRSFSNSGIVFLTENDHESSIEYANSCIFNMVCSNE